MSTRCRPGVLTQSIRAFSHMGRSRQFCLVACWIWCAWVSTCFTGFASGRNRLPGRWLKLPPDSLPETKLQPPDPGWVAQVSLLRPGFLLASGPWPCWRLEHESGGEGELVVIGVELRGRNLHARAESNAHPTR